MNIKNAVIEKLKKYKKLSSVIIALIGGILCFVGLYSLTVSVFKHALDDTVIMFLLWPLLGALLYWGLKTLAFDKMWFVVTSLLLGVFLSAFFPIALSVYAIPKWSGNMVYLPLVLLLVPIIDAPSSYYESRNDIPFTWAEFGKTLVLSVIGPAAMLFAFASGMWLLIIPVAFAQTLIVPIFIDMKRVYLIFILIFGVISTLIGAEIFSGNGFLEGIEFAFMLLFEVFLVPFEAIKIVLTEKVKDARDERKLRDKLKR